ncbi:MAG: galactose-1-phosphate uridylyltransferase [Solirubrobacterales bacterium]
MKKTVTSLADGRELIYFDRREDVVRDAVDARPGPGSADFRGEIRYDRILGEWVAIAAQRQERTHLPPSEECPLCPSSPGHPTEIPAADYDVVVFENRFPSFAGGLSTPALSAAPPPGEPFARRPAAGRCEVCCFSPDHHGSFAWLEPDRVRMIVDVWADRTAALSAMPGVEQVFCFENRGEEIGVTLHHPHGQVYGYPFVTPQTERMIGCCRAHHRRTGDNLIADQLRAEREAGERVVLAGEHWTAFVPHAARWPVELCLYPHRRRPDLAALETEERDELAVLYPDLLRRLEAAFGEALPYVAAWHQAPVREGRDLGHLHLQILSVRRSPGKLKYLAGSEAAMGAFINDRLPEETAALLREARGAA